MGGKKAVEKSREWEKERRDKLNTGFNDLCKLLPDHDPSISLSKMDILKKAAEYIRLLQEQNEEIIKSGNDDVLKNEAKRLKKRVAYLVLKTKDLVTALRAAGVPIPKNKRKGKAKKGTAKKVVNGQDQNHSPQPPVANSAHEVPRAIVLTGAAVTGSGFMPVSTLGTKKVKCGCDKAAKKNPLSELNCASTTSPVVPTIVKSVTVVACNSLSQATILNASNPTNIHALSVEKNMLAPTLGPGTLILRDGRVVAVPPPAPILPQILVKPQPAVIVMQRAQPVPSKKDKFSFIMPLRREITQTTYANKAPIPAIKAFRMESCPRIYKPKAKKKTKEAKPDGSTTVPVTATTAPKIIGKVTSLPVNNVASSSKLSVSTSCISPNPNSSPKNHLKRKAGATVAKKCKIRKPDVAPIPVVEDRLENLVSEHVKESERPRGNDMKENTESNELAGKVADELESTCNEAKGVVTDSLAQGEKPLADPCPPKINNENDNTNNTNGEVVIEHGAQSEYSDQRSIPQDNCTIPPSSLPIDGCQSDGRVVVYEEEEALVSAQLSLADSNKAKEVINEENKIPEQLVEIGEGETIQTTVSTKQIGVSTPPVSESFETVDGNQLKTGGTYTETESNQTTEKLELPNCSDVSESEKSDFKDNLNNIVKPFNVKLGEFPEPPEKSPDDGTSVDVSMNIDPSQDIDHSKPIESEEAHQYGRTENLPESTDATSANNISQANENHTLDSGEPEKSISHSESSSEKEKFNDQVQENTEGISPSSEKPSVECMKTIVTQDQVDPKLQNTSIIPLSSQPERMFSFDETIQTHIDNCTNDTATPQMSADTIRMNSSLLAETVGDNGKTSASYTKTFSNISSQIESSVVGNEKVISCRDNVAYPPDNSNAKRVKDSKSNKNMSNVTEGTYFMESTFKKISRNDHIAQANEVFPVASQENKASQHLQARPGQSHIKTSSFGTMPPCTYTTSSQMYSLAISGVPPEPPRPENFFNYENPIATLPSADPFFSNFMGKPVDGAPTSCSGTPNTSFNYSSFTTQAPPVRSVARQLFPADPLCSIANSYNLLNNRQNELDPNLPPLNSTNSTQMFQFGTYSSAGSFRDSLFFPNEFVSTPTKTNSSVVPLENINSQNEKDSTALCHPVPNYTDLLHPTTSINTFSNITCSFGVGNASSSSSYIPTDFNQINSIQSTPAHKQFISAEPQSLMGGQHSKHNPKSCGNDGNFSMNVITSSSSTKAELKGDDQPQMSRAPVYQKSNNSELSQNLNFHYVHSSSQVHPPHVAPEMSYNVNPREIIQPPRNLQSHNYRATQNKMVATSSSVTADKGVQKSNPHNLNAHKSPHAKEFNNCIAMSGGSSIEGMRDNERFNAQSSSFVNNACNQYPEPSSKTRRANPSSNNTMPTFHSIGNNQLSSNNQGVQTQQSYLGNSNSQLATQIPKNASHISSSGNHSFTGSSQSINHQAHLMQPDKKYSRSTSVNQDLPCAVAAPHYSMKPTMAHHLNTVDPPECNTQNNQSQKNYQSVSSLAQTANKISSNNHVNFSTGNTFPHPSVTMHQRPFQGPIFSSSYVGGTSSNSSELIYSNPTTVVPSNQLYSHSANAPSSAPTPGHNQNIFSLSHMTTGPTVHSTQMSNRSNLVAPSNVQLFSAVESLAQHNHELVNQTHKSQINSSSLGNSNQHSNQTHSTTSQSNGHTFSGTSTSQSMHMSTNHKSSHNDVMPNFSMSNLTNYPHSTNLSHLENQQMSKRLHGTSNQNYNQIPTSKANISANKVTNQYPPGANNNPLAPAKQCDYPLASILTGMNDPALSNSVIPNEVARNHPNKNTSESVSNEKSSGCTAKVVGKQYSTNTEGNAFKPSDTSCTADYLRNKDTERNSFIPIIEDVRLNSEFSNDLFSSLQVPTGGAHSDSISPTAAFLLAFPLVSTSKNTENLQETDQPDNNTSTPTTILQIGNIDPPNSELFHPLEFGKDMEASDYLGHVQDKCKRKESVGQVKQKKHAVTNAYSHTYNYPGMPADYSAVHYDQSWTDSQNKSKPLPERKKTEKSTKQFNNNSNNNYEFCKQDKKKKNKISVNWMAAPDANEAFQKEGEATSFHTSSLQFPMDIDSLPDLCTTKKNNNSVYSWSPSKSLLPLDSGLMIPSTLPTLVGDLALGTTTPSDPYSKRCDNKKTLEKPPEKRENPQKVQNNFLSVSQLVDPKSKKQKLPETKCKKTEKKKGAAFQKRKESNEPCMYPDNFLPPLGWDKYRYKNNYSAEALIGSQDINETLNFSYQQNANYFMGTDFNQEHHPQSQQQYQNSLTFSQNQFTSFVAEEYQNENFSLNHPQSSSTKRGTGADKRDSRCREESTSSRFLGGAGTYHHAPTLQPYPTVTLPPSSSTTTSQPSIFTSNTTTSVTNFNLSTIFPEINERTDSQGQQSNQTQQQRSNIQHSHNSMNSFTNNASNNYL